MNARLLLLTGALCLQLGACAGPAQIDQSALADAAVQDFVGNAACIQTHYAREDRHPHPCSAGMEPQKKEIAFAAPWRFW